MSIKMAFLIKTTAKERKDLWNACREIIMAHNKEINENSTNLRDFFYINRDYLFNDYLSKGKITKAAYKLYESDRDAENYVNQDIYSKLEKKGYKRPDAKDIGIMYWKGSKYTVDEVDGYLSQIRGYIFCEKEGAATKIKDISNYGWAVVAGQGNATRSIRKDLKSTNKPVVILHDWDPDGIGIKDGIKNKTRRTSHLDLDLGDRVIDIGLNEKQVDFLIKNYNVPCISLPDKHKGKDKNGVLKWPRDYRVELSAFSVVQKLSGYTLLDFVKAEMKKLGMSLSLEPTSKEKLFRIAVKIEIVDQVRDITKKILQEKDISGMACKAKLTKDIDITNNQNIIDAITEALENIEDNVEWVDEEEMEEECLENVPTSWINEKEGDKQ